MTTQTEQPMLTDQPAAKASIAAAGTADVPPPLSTSIFGSGASNLFSAANDAKPKQTVSPFSSLSTVATHRGFEPFQAKPRGHAKPPPMVPSATPADIPPPPPQTEAQRAAAEEAKRLFGDLKYAFGHPPQPVTGADGLYVVRDPGSGEYCLWRNKCATDRDELVDRAEEAETAETSKTKRKQRFDGDAWQNALFTLGAKYPPTGESVEFNMIPKERTGEFVYTIGVTSVGGATLLEPKSSSVLAGRDFNQQTLLTLYASCRNRFNHTAIEWLDTWATGKVERDVCTAYLAGRCHNSD